MFKSAREWKGTAKLEKKVSMRHGRYVTIPFKYKFRRAMQNTLLNSCVKNENAFSRSSLWGAPIASNYFMGKSTNLNKIWNHNFVSCRSSSKPSVPRTNLELIVLITTKQKEHTSTKSHLLQNIWRRQASLLTLTLTSCTGKLWFDRRSCLNWINAQCRNRKRETAK